MKKLDSAHAKKNVSSLVSNIFQRKKEMKSFVTAQKSLYKKWSRLVFEAAPDRHHAPVAARVRVDGVSKVEHPCEHVHDLGEDALVATEAGGVVAVPQSGAGLIKTFVHTWARRGSGL